MLKILGVTGGIGAGKTTVCKAFACLGVPIYNADERSKELMISSAMLKRKIVDLLGTQSFSSKGNINRQFIAQIVFNDPKKLEQLNAIIHPLVVNDFKKWSILQNERKKAPFIIKESAIIIDADARGSVDFLANVTANEEVRIKRVLKRDKHRTTKDIKKIIERQLTDEKKNKYCDFIINNNDEDQLIPQIILIYNMMKNKT